jgi:hypothetical protein
VAILVGPPHMSTKAVLTKIERRLVSLSGVSLPYGVSFSKGAVVWDGQEDSASLIKRGDRLMYAEKGSRR